MNTANVEAGGGAPVGATAGAGAAGGVLVVQILVDAGAEMKVPETTTDPIVTHLVTNRRGVIEFFWRHNYKRAKKGRFFDVF